VQRIHVIEDALSTLRQRSSLSGNDFLPVVVRLDELISHLTQIRALHERSEPVPLPAKLAATDDETDKAPRHTTVLERPLSRGGARPQSSGRGQLFAEMLRTLTLEEARALGRSARLLTRGLAEIPPHYVPVAKEVCIQMIRNAIAHGIEPPDQRVALG